MRRGSSSFAAVLAPFLVAGFALLASSAASTAQASAKSLDFTGRPLTEALLELRERGLRIVFTTNVVRSTMIIATEPGQTQDARALLEELLEPFDLQARDAPGASVVIVPRATPRVEAKAGVRGSIVGVVRARPTSDPIEGVRLRIEQREVDTVSAEDGSFAMRDLADGFVTLEVRRRGYVVERIQGVPIAAGEVTELPILLNPAPLTEEELVVTPSRISILRQEPAAPVALSRDDILSLPHLADDFFRALSLLPGIAGNDVSSQFNIRGGRSDETRIVLDGQELYETYHLKDFDSALSIISPSTLASVDLSTGSFSAEHGDRMSGVLDMRTLTPAGRQRTLIGLGLLTAEAGGSGSFHEQRGSWIAQVRRGSNDFAGKLLGPEKPRYWDAFGKLDYQLASGHSLRANVLHSDDSFDFTEVTEDSRKRIGTDYSSSYLWLTDQTILGPRHYFDSAVSRTRVDRDRNGFETDEKVEWTVSDRRELVVLALRQAWNHQLSGSNFLRWGFELRDFESQYDYSSDFDFENPLAIIRDNGPSGQITYRDTFEESHNSLYVSNRMDLGKSATLELGLRYDDHSQTDESHLTPRLNLARTMGRHSLIRLAWGRFNQSQRPYELQVEDGDTAFRPVERSEHRLLGFEHLFQAAPKAGLALRVELYQRLIKNPQPRWENLYEPLNEFQEVEPDRVRIAAERAYAEGLELFLRGRLGRKADWFVNYSLSSIEDEIDGRRQLRRFDQTHSLNLDFDYRVTENWALNFALRLHTGWPTTPLELLEVASFDPLPGADGEAPDEELETFFIPVLGAPFSARLTDYHRLDLRASRRWTLKKGRLTFYADIQNVYNRKNIAGFDFEIDDEEGTIESNPELWTGFFPSLGLRWEF